MRTGTAAILLVNLLIGRTLTEAAEARPAPDAACDARENVPEHIRPLDCSVATLAAEGLARSETFRALVDRIGRLNGIVYVMPGRVFVINARRALEGGLAHRVTLIGSRRALFVTVLPGRGDRPLGVMAHEFQHAIEVLSSPASTEAEIDTLFERMGIPVSSGITETTAAIEVERVVARELSACRERRLVADSRR